MIYDYSNPEKWKDVNLNDNIRFKLTKRGMEVLAENHNKYVDKISGLEERTWEYYKGKQDAKGYYEMQIWCFIDEFADHIGFCKEAVIEGLNISVFIR